MTAEEAVTAYDTATAQIVPPPGWSGTEQEYRDAYMKGFEAGVVSVVEDVASSAFQQGVELGKLAGFRVGVERARLEHKKD